MTGKFIGFLIINAFNQTMVTQTNDFIFKFIQLQFEQEILKPYRYMQHNHCEILL